MVESTAWAIPVCQANFCLLISEAGRSHTKTQVQAKIPAYEGGYFLRDPASKLDCEFFTAEAFLQLYKLRAPDDGKNPLLPVTRI